MRSSRAVDEVNLKPVLQALHEAERRAPKLSGLIIWSDGLLSGAEPEHIAAAKPYERDRPGDTGLMKRPLR